ncbi:MAG: fibronectin type III domain-containing protein [Chloroflexi bacterium]|nr:fibronectin type III domain-containing protein [Chloroflexota bacterium]
MGERFTYVFLAAIAVLAIACGNGSDVDAPEPEAPEQLSTSELPQVPLPGAPHIIRTTPGDGFVTIDWNAPEPDVDITGYLITGVPEGSRSVAADVLSARVGGLANGQEYVFTVRATNESGFGPDSPTSGPVLVAAVPGPPPALAATELPEGGVRLAWLAPPRDGGSEIVTYIVNSETEGVMRVLEGQPTTGYSLAEESTVATRPGLAASETMVFVLDLDAALSQERFRVAAANELGLGQWSSWAMTEPFIVLASDPVNESVSDGQGQTDPEALPVADPVPGAGNDPTESPTDELATPNFEDEPGTVESTPTPDVEPTSGTPTPSPPSGPGAVITVDWLPTLYGPDGPPPGWQPSLIGNTSTPFLLHSIEAWSTDPVDVFRGDIDWGDGTSDQAWFEDPVYVSSRNADGLAQLFAYHTYATPGRYLVTISVSAINHSNVIGQTTIEAFIDQ